MVCFATKRKPVDKNQSPEEYLEKVTSQKNYKYNPKLEVEIIELVEIETGMEERQVEEIEVSKCKKGYLEIFGRCFEIGKCSEMIYHDDRYLHSHGSFF